MFRICSEFSVMFRLYSEYLAQKLLCSESLDFVVIYILKRSPDNEVHSTTRRTSKPKPKIQNNVCRQEEKMTFIFDFKIDK